MHRFAFPIALALLLSSSDRAAAQSLRGSKASLARQVRQAELHDYTFLRRPADVERFVRAGLLVPVRGNADYELAQVSFPYARPEVRIFIERLGRQYRAACGEKLVVTSAVRPRSMRLANSTNKTVHPTGMAVDLRRSTSPACRRWLENTLLHLERRGVAEATRETRPPHYHVALFPKPYLRYIGGAGASTVRVASNGAAATGAAAATYRVRRGDTLWAIARRHGTTVEAIQAENGLRSTRVLAGQTLRIPRSN